MNDLDGASNPAIETKLWLAQRISAVILALMVFVHLGTIMYAVRDGLTAAEIIDRVGGHLGWALFYGLFVAALAVHAPIGIRAILAEITALPRKRIDLLCFMAAVLIAYLGYRVVRDFYALGSIA